MLTLILSWQDIPEPVTVIRSHWWKDPLSRCAYSHIALGSTGDVLDHIAAPEDRIVFAGEHTSRAFEGTVHGAYVSGIRAANDIVTMASGEVRISH